MPHSTPSRRARQIETLRRQFAQADGLPFADVLTADRLDQALRDEQAVWRAAVSTPVLTLWALLTQVVSPDGSCRAAVAGALAGLVSRGERPCSPKTGPYCQARHRLPESLRHRLVGETGQDLHRRRPPAWRWKGRRVQIADGTTVSRPDTPANQAAYPQSPSQQPGLGFPLARLVVVVSRACGTVREAARGRYQGQQAGANALLRALAEAFDPGDVLLADRYFGGWFDLARWRRRGVDVVVRLHQLRRCDLRRGRRLGPGEHLVAWPKPARPDWMDEATDASWPAALTLREVRVRVRQRGFRTPALVVVTTLLDAGAYPAADLAEWYRLRGHAELDLRSLKETLGMGVLRCHSPGMVRKEVWAHLLTYNLIRAVLAAAADDLGADPRELSFKGAVQALTAFAERLLEAGRRPTAELWEWLLLMIGAHLVGDRPDRVEPRTRKRRPKQHPLLTKPRDEARKKLRHKR